MKTAFQRLSAYNILRNWKTYQLRYIEVEGRNYKAEQMRWYVCSLRIPNVKESNDKWYDACQRTLPYAMYVESNRRRELDKVKAIRSYYLRLHDGAIRSLWTVKHRIRKRTLCSRERTTNKASICAVVNVAKKISLLTYQYGPKNPHFRSTIDSMVGIWNFTKSCFGVFSGHYKRISNTVDKIWKQRTDNWKWRSNRLGDEQPSRGSTLSTLVIMTHHPSQLKSGVLYRM